MWYVVYPDELYHHGIKGQKWGIRGYQNEDGSVTPAGAQRYYVGGKKTMGSKSPDDRAKRVRKLDKMSAEKTYKTLKKEINKKKHAGVGLLDKWTPDKQQDVGSNSRKLLEEFKKNEEAYKNLDSVKEADALLRKRLNRLGNDFESGRIDIEAHDKRWKKLLKEYEESIPKKNYTSYAWTNTKDSRKLAGEDYIRKAGKNLSVAYLLDLGYDKQSAERLVDKMANKNLTLGSVVLYNNH